MTTTEISTPPTTVTSTPTSTRLSAAGLGCQTLGHDGYIGVKVESLSDEYNLCDGHLNELLSICNAVGTQLLSTSVGFDVDVSQQTLRA